MAAPKAPLLGGAKKDVSLDETVFGAEIKAHLVHEAVRAEQNAKRQGTRAAKSRGLVSGGRAKPWRQKGTGRARQGTIRAPQFTGGGVAFAPSPRDFDVKVRRVNILKVQPKPKRRGQIKGTKQGWKKAIVKLHPGYTIQFFEGAQV